MFRFSEDVDKLQASSPRNKGGEGGRVQGYLLLANAKAAIGVSYFLPSFFCASDSQPDVMVASDATAR